MKIKLTCSWCNDEELYERFNRVYISKSNQIHDINFTNDEAYDWLVIINHPRYNINFPKERTIGVIMEPSWTKHYELRYILEEKCKYIISHKKEEKAQYIYYPGLLPPHINYNNNEDLDYLISNTNIKTKKCSMVVSYNNNTPHKDCLYKQRTNFAKQILKTDLDIDIYGNDWETSGILDQRIKGHILNKKDALKDYKFSIAIENCIEEDYFTEKLTDCILTDTTPIYYGCPKINRFFSNVHELHHLDDVSEVTRILQTEPLIQEKTLLATKYNLYIAITKLLKHL